jgi:hypothetical protein
MCDYSLCGLPNRLAAEGEVLEVHKFATGSMGMASPIGLRGKSDDHAVKSRGFWNSLKRAFQSQFQSETAVCIPPGASLILTGIPPYLQERYGVEDQEGVRFLQTGVAVNFHRDAVRFQNGRIAGLQELPEGLQVEVLSLAHVFDEEPRELPQESSVYARPDHR